MKQHTDRKTDGQRKCTADNICRDEMIDGQTEKMHSGQHLMGWNDRQTNKQTDKHTNRQTEKKA